MTILATAVWEFRASGNNDNAGGFDSGIASAGTDYTLQDAAQLTLTDLAMTAGGTTLTSATGGFTAAMIGNAIHIKSGTNFTAGWYFITARADTNTVTLDRDATNASNASSGTGSVGGAIATPNTDIDGVVVAGNTCYYKSGTYTLAATVTFSDGAEGTRVQHIGYKTTRGDNPTLTDRPVFACGAYIFTFGLFSNVVGIVFTGTGANVCVARTNASYAMITNCKSTNSSTTANRAAFNGRNIFYFKCEAISTLGRAFSEAFSLDSCYAHDSDVGLFTNLQLNNTINSVFDTCVTGAQSSSTSTFKQNVVYNCTTGLAVLAAVQMSASNNIITGCTTGISATAANQSGNVIKNNCMNNTTDYSNVTGIDDIDADPLLTDPANGDFTLQTGSPCLNAGLQIGATEGVVGAYKINIGVDQDDNAAASGGQYAMTWCG